MTQDILTTIDQRRLLKNKNHMAYRKLIKEIKLDIKTAKDEWLNEKYDEIKYLVKKHNSFKLHRKIKEFTLNKKHMASHTMVN